MNVGIGTFFLSIGSCDIPRVHIYLYFSIYLYMIRPMPSCSTQPQLQDRAEGVQDRAEGVQDRAEGVQDRPEGVDDGGEIHFSTFYSFSEYDLPQCRSAMNLFFSSIVSLEEHC